MVRKWGCGDPDDPGPEGNAGGASELTLSGSGCAMTCACRVPATRSGLAAMFHVKPRDRLEAGELTRLVQSPARVV